MKKPTRRNDKMDAICEVVGFSATISLMRWFGGGHVCIPVDKDAIGPLRAILGRMAFARLVDVYAGETLWVPVDPFSRYKASDARAREIVRLLMMGASRKTVVDSLDVPPHIVTRVAVALMLQKGKECHTIVKAKKYERSQTAIHEHCDTSSKDDAHA